MARSPEAVDIVGRCGALVPYSRSDLIPATSSRRAASRSWSGWGAGRRVPYSGGPYEFGGSSHDRLWASASSMLRNLCTPRGALKRRPSRRLRSERRHAASMPASASRAGGGSGTSSIRRYLCMDMSVAEAEGAAQPFCVVAISRAEGVALHQVKRPRRHHVQPRFSDIHRHQL